MTFQKIFSASFALLGAAVLATSLAGCGAPEEAMAEQEGATTASLTSATLSGDTSGTTASMTSATAKSAADCNNDLYRCVAKCNLIPKDWIHTYNDCTKNCLDNGIKCHASIAAPPSPLANP